MAKVDLRSSLTKWFFKKAWPWIARELGPILLEQIRERFERVIQALLKKLDEWFDQRTNANAEAADKRAAASEEAAMGAATDSEAEKHRAVAQVWREVAEQFRRENEELKKKLAEALSETISAFESETSDLAIESMIEEDEDGNPRVAHSDVILRLSEPDESAST